MLQGQLAHVQVEADAQLPAKIGDEIDGLLSELLLSEFGSNRLLFAIDVDGNPIAFGKNDSEIDV